MTNSRVFGCFKCGVSKHMQDQINKCKKIKTELCQFIFLSCTIGFLLIEGWAQSQKPESNNILKAKKLLDLPRRGLFVSRKKL